VMAKRNSIKFKIAGLAIIVMAGLIGLDCDSILRNDSNNAPVIKSITVNPSIVTTSQYVSLTCVATDDEPDNLSFTWKCNAGIYSNNVGAKVTWQAPSRPCIASCTVIVNDGKAISQDSVLIQVTYPNRAPLQAYNPSPSSGAQITSTTPTLTWQSGDPDGDPISYDIIFGKEHYDQLVKINHKGESFSPGNLEAGNKYEWRIIAKDDHDHRVEGHTWQFTVK